MYEPAKVTTLPDGKHESAHTRRSILLANAYNATMQDVAFIIGPPVSCFLMLWNMLKNRYNVVRSFLVDIGTVGFSVK